MFIGSNSTLAFEDSRWPRQTANLTLLTLIRIASGLGPRLRLCADAYGVAQHGKLILMEDVLAKRIVEIAENGERDPEKLCEAILSEHGINRADDKPEEM